MKYIMIVIVFLGLFIWGRQSLAGYEEPQYKQVIKDGRFEIRTYQPVHIAQTTVQGSFTPALKIGFRRIADYIFGGNVEDSKIAMTVPVISSIPKQGSIDVFFVMPHSYTLETLPEPKASNVQLQKTDWSEVAIYRFGGWATEERVLAMKQRLFSILKERNITVVGEPRVAQFNPPFVPPPFRKNEVMVQVQR